MSFMYTDPRSVDKLLAKELNSLSFDDREALSEQLHGVRSLSPKETPEMLNNAFHELQNEINKNITALLIQMPSSSDRSRPRSSGQAASASASASSYDVSYDDAPNIISSSSTIFSSLTSTNSCTRNSSNISLRREYLMDILSSSFASPGGEESMASTTPSSSIDYNNNNNNTSDSESESMNTTNESNNSNSNNNNNKYPYIRSFWFCIKLLRSELFDIKKAVDRYMLCIDFLVDYFGLFALERPLFLNDLNKEEHKLLKEGQLQLLPSRDRSGRRVAVFLGSFGYGYSHMNRFRICMYIMGQVASDDECTQKNGLVCIYSRHSTAVREIVEYGSHQTECNRYMNSVPVRYSAFHCFLPDDITRGMILNMIGKRTRLITRIHTVRGITETEYLLRCFGINTDNFPVTNTGSVKTKNLIKWIRQRTSLENQQRNAGSLLSQNQIVGIECPDLNSVLIRNGGPAWEHPGNIKFRSILIRRERERENQKTRPQKNQFLNSIIQESWANGLRFLSYVDENEWYVEITDYNILRTKVFQALRDQSARRKRLMKAVSHDSSTNLFTDLDNNTSTGCFLSLKRQKL